MCYCCVQLLFSFLGLTAQLVGPLFPDQGLNLGPGHSPTRWTAMEFPSSYFLIVFYNHVYIFNINNLRYADDTTLMAESEEELKSLLMKVKEDNGKLA